MKGILEKETFAIQDYMLSEHEILMREQGLADINDIVLRIKKEAFEAGQEILKMELMGRELPKEWIKYKYPTFEDYLNQIKDEDKNNK